VSVIGYAYDAPRDHNISLSPGRDHPGSKAATRG
jgi:hypothetical protein